MGKNLSIAAGYVAVSAALVVTAAQAQEAAPAPAARGGNTIDEIIVTARKRDESILKVPVVVTALAADQLQKLQVTEMNDLPKLVPGLNLGNNVLSIGPQVSLRGVGTSSSDPGVDQSVSLNIDGLALGQGLAFSSGMFDLQQIEVFKGPQALFYGKSSPGGVIALRTADPTDTFELSGRAGYDFNAKQGRGEVIVSGPLSDTFKGRLAGMYTAGDGYLENNAVAVPTTGAVNPSYDNEPRPRNYIARGTLLWNPTSAFSARLKMNLAHDRGIDAELAQLSSCPNGVGFAPALVPFIGGDNCKFDRELRIVSMNPANYRGIPHGGVPYLENKQEYGTLELNYEVAPQFTVTSTTGDYYLRSSSLINTSHTTAAAPTIAVWNNFYRHDFTEELRVNSNFTGPVNFTAGGFYQDGEIFDHVTLVGNNAYGPAIGAIKTDASTTVDIKTYSVFGQARWQIVDQLELAAGARWTDEKREEDNLNYQTGQFYNVANPKLEAKNTSPEVTLTYTPTDDLTFFGAYKRAYKSGSFSIATPALPGADNSFGDEKVKGGEVGVKARLLDRRLLANIAAYDYRYEGLQVGAIEPTSATSGTPIIRTVNAGSARTYGIDFDASFRPDAIEGLGLNASVNWNHGRYEELNNVPCYPGQTVAKGCNQFQNPVTQLYQAQDLSGTGLIRAPDWQSTFGFDYDLPVGNDMTLVFTNSNQYSSKYVTYLAVGRPNQDNFQKSFFKYDASVALRGPDNRWEVALIGKNLSDKFTTGNCAPSNYSGGLFFTAPTTGGATSSQIAEVGCYTEPGREVWLRLTYTPFGAH
jgi:iron complex outermembrane receptor protein